MILLCKRDMSISSSRSGFTLIELMVGLAITSVIITAIFAAYTTQQRLYVSQDQIAEMQQNIRAVIEVMGNDIRMAGYDPENTGEFGVSETTCTSCSDDLVLGQIVFSYDLIDENGVLDDFEEIRFELENDINRLGEVTNAQNLLKVEVSTSGANKVEPIAENIQAIEFLFLDEDGNQTLVPDNARSVNVSVLARAGDQDRKFQHTSTYTTPSGAIWGPYNDRYRRRFVMANIQLRNIGI